MSSVMIAASKARSIPAGQSSGVSSGRRIRHAKMRRVGGSQKVREVARNSYLRDGQDACG